MQQLSEVCRVSRGGGRVRRCVTAAMLLLSLASAGSAQDAVGILHALQTGRDFRVRAQAAFALGRKQEAAYAPALEGALKDNHPIVRAAAASALGRIGSPSSLPALRAATHDRDPSVVEQARAALANIEVAAPAPKPSIGQVGVAVNADALHTLNKARYALVIGEMHNESGFAGPDLARVMGTSLERELASLRTVASFPQSDGVQLERAVQRGLPVLRLEGNVRQITRERVGEQLSVHCEISLLVMDQSDRNLRTVLKGAATGLEPSMGPPAAQEKRLALRAVDGAVRSALRNASSAIESAAASADVAGHDTASASLRPRTR